MGPRDLRQLAEILQASAAVVAMETIHAGERGEDVIGLRHDIDDNPGALPTAVKIAVWEAARGYRSTFFVLHTARYWRDEPGLRAAVDEIAGHGHEIGIHANAIAAALTDGGDPASILAAAIDRLRGYGHTVVGVAPHGDRLCHRAGFINDELFSECPRPEMGAPDRTITLGTARVKLDPRPLAEFGLQYETYRLPHGRYLSDSGGHWNVPPSTVARGAGQLHILQHPDWWADAFADP